MGKVGIVDFRRRMTDPSKHFFSLAEFSQTKFCVDIYQPCYNSPHTNSYQEVKTVRKCVYIFQSIVNTKESWGIYNSMSENAQKRFVHSNSYDFSNVLISRVLV